MPRSDTREIRFRLASLPLRPCPRKPPQSHTETSARALPRITRLMALAIKLEQLMRQHPHLSYQELAGLGRVSAPRLTQILNLLHLAPDLQQRLLWLEPNGKGRERMHEAAVRRISRVYDWRLQRLAFEAIVSKRKSRSAGGRDA